MAAIGTGWVDGAWVEAGWVVGAWSGVAAPVPAVTARGGGYITREEIERLAKLAKKAIETRQKRWKVERTTQATRIDELRAVYDRLQGIIVASPEIEEIAEAVRPYAPETQARDRVPISQAVDFTGLLNSARATARLAEALSKLQADNTEDEDAMVVLMMAVM